ncbi:MAG: HNH endonuclease signature motif containing protein [Chloroflexota bacterium]|nr:HNH endonuclease signature motif containing protein [Chloroflexota bacterium]MDE2945541.1 HNH endonuclease signature motif containing protein [Chloroflexota bacterium]
MYIPAGLRDRVVARARGNCEYCQTQASVVVWMHIDHIVPRAVGGETNLDNLCLACISCNGAKHRFQLGIDPDTGQRTPLYNPRKQVWLDHFAWSDDGTILVGLTSVGRATVERLRMNREDMIRSRRRWIAAGWHPPFET